MTERLKTDICVIGAGSGGLSVAVAAAAFGVPVVLIEQGKMGGDCLNTGCVPSKALIAAARRARMIAEAPAFGVTAASADVDFQRVHAHVHEIIAAIAPNDSRQRMTGLGVRVIEGGARFKDAATVLVGETEVRARRFVIATGSTPSIPPIPGLETVPYLTNETIFDLTARPDHLIVIGGGPVGLELAQAFRRLGSAVTVLDAAEPLAREDPECAGVVLNQLEREGVVIRSGVSVDRVATADLDVQVIAGDQTIQGSHLLIATGRRPRVDGLGLDAAGIQYGPNGIAVDKGLRTTNNKVYAIGDVAGGPQFTHAANDHAGLVIRNALFRLPVKVKGDDAIPRVTFTDPELAHIGLGEAEARARGHRINILRWPYHENDRAQAERAPHGHIKVITGKKGRILGATIVGTEAGELIGTWVLAISQGLTVRAVIDMIVPYPTLGEVGKRAAITYFQRALTNRWVRRIVGLLRRFG